jgi:hypothetical protein
MQPAWSQATVERTAQRFRLTLPAVGLGRRGNKAPWVPAQSWFWVGAVLCLFAALLTVFFLAIPHLVTHNTAGGKPAVQALNDLVVPWPVWAGLAGFWGIVIAGTLWGLNLCRRHGVVEVSNGVLGVEQTSLFGRRQWHWPCVQIAAVQTGPTGLTIGGGTSTTGAATPGGMRVPELHLYIEDGGRIGLFAGRSEAELDWVAGQLRQALQVGTNEDGGG